ncbi:MULTISPECIES: TIGR00366 family protein [Pseudomonas]|uniref:Short-chain fatty acid transporter n=1 Tax=Pseudomonas quercus TaxID=2722792 RepID=A0ABX0YCS2_9PSED|nr:MULTISPECIES: TIGR00366 family protein [Pseudomonas]MBF7142660.1 short-chain fatty acid transporter [Pseudomonas sp. LY10J]NJP01198.1 short-chain fatty acid transporter [Pseudomonas quercus]
MTSHATAPRSLRTRLTDTTIRVFERTIPDPFVLAVFLTFLIAVGAAIWGPQATAANIVSGWYKGFFSIFTFALQITLVLVLGHALAHAPVIQRLFTRLIRLARTPAQAGALIFVSVAVTSFFNWGFGLVMSALLAREIAKRMHVDFAWIVAAGFSGWVVWAGGLSSSIVLAQSTAGSPMNVVEKVTGQVLGLGGMVFAPFNLVPNLVMVLVIPVVLAVLRPRGDSVIALDIAKHPDPILDSVPQGPWTFAQRLEYSWLGSALMGAVGVLVMVFAYLGQVPFAGVNAVILVMFTAGIVLHRYPLAYANAVKNAARQSGSMMLQYPLYGGLMGIMEATGLPGVIAHAFVAISNAHTLPFWSYVCSLVVTFLIPSGGGHWAVQGPFVIPAAVTLHASLPGTTMAVAMGEQVSNMLQPFWAAPVVAMAGVGVQRVLGFTFATFLVGAVVYGASLLLLL